MNNGWWLQNPISVSTSRIFRLVTASPKPKQSKKLTGQDHLITMTQNLNHYEKILSRSHSNYLAQISIEMTDANNQINDVLSKLTALGTVLMYVFSLQLLIRPPLITSTWLMIVLWIWWPVYGEWMFTSRDRISNLVYVVPLVYMVGTARLTDSIHGSRPF